MSKAFQSGWAVVKADPPIHCERCGTLLRDETGRVHYIGAKWEEGGTWQDKWLCGAGWIPPSDCAKEVGKEMGLEEPTLPEGNWMEEWVNRPMRDSRGRIPKGKRKFDDDGKEYWGN